MLKDAIASLSVLSASRVRVLKSFRRLDFCSQNYKEKGNAPFAVCITLAFVILQVICASAASMNFKSLVSFSGTNGPATGAVPEARLLLANDGYLYGTTIAGGASNLGTVFKISTNGDFTSIIEFTPASGYSIQPGLMQAQDGWLYGTTAYGGPNGLGTVFRINTNGEFAVFASFTPVSGFDSSALIQAQDGNLYGTAWEGGTNGYGQFGTIFKLSPSGEVAPLYCFGSKIDEFGIALDGQGPQAPLVEGSDGAFYGTTTAGGAKGGFGTIFRITTNGVFSSLYSFNGTNGSYPNGALVEGTDGSLYGTTSGGGPVYANGIVFRITKSGTLTVLHEFSGYPNDGAVPEFGPLVAGTDGQWYGTTFYGGGNGEGCIWRMTPQGEVAVLYSFSRPDYDTGTNIDGSTPWAGLAQTSNGNLYGVSGYGGEHAVGTVFCVSSSDFSRPLIQTISRTNSTTIVGWNALPWRAYQLQSNSALENGSWMDVGNPVAARNRIAIAVDSAPFPAIRMYRLILLP